MSPPGLVPFCFALRVTMSSSRENISCSLSSGMKSRMLDVAVLEALALEVAFEPADGDVLQGVGVEQGAAGEPARVDHLHQRGERFRMAVVWGGAEEQTVSLRT